MKRRGLLRLVHLAHVASLPLVLGCGRGEGDAPARASDAGTGETPETRDAGTEASSPAGIFAVEVPGSRGAQRVAIAADDEGEPVLGFTAGSPPRAWLHQPGAAEELVDVSPSAGGQATYASVAASGRGRALFAFQFSDGLVPRVFAARRPSREAGVVRPAEGDAFSFAPSAYEPRALIDRRGQDLVVWNQLRDLGFGVQIATRDEAAAAWRRPASSSDVISLDVFHSNAPRPAAGPDGAVTIAWYQSPKGGSLGVFAAERTDGSAAFPKQTPADHVSDLAWPVSSHPVANPKPAIASDGRVALVWTQDTAADEARVFVRQRARAATFAEAKPAVAISEQGGKASGAWIAFAGAELHAVWSEERGGDARVVHAVLDEAGAVVSREVLSSPSSRAFAATLSGDGTRVVAAHAELGGTRVVLTRLAGATRDQVLLAQPEATSLVELGVDARGGRAHVAWIEKKITPAETTSRVLRAVVPTE